MEPGRRKIRRGNIEFRIIAILFVIGFATSITLEIIFFNAWVLSYLISWIIAAGAVIVAIAARSKNIFCFAPLPIAIIYLISGIYSLCYSHGDIGTLLGNDIVDAFAPFIGLFWVPLSIYCMTWPWRYSD